jgi:hypothetical protein
MIQSRMLKILIYKKELEQICFGFLRKILKTRQEESYY